jgi:hypothetical protein
MQREIPLRLVVERPPRGVTFRMQRGKADLVEPVRAGANELVFEFTLRVGESRPDGRPNLLGPFAQGRPEDRFVYVSSGTLAGQVDSVWTRRAKILVADITWPLVEQVLAGPGVVLEGRIAGTGRDGGPACASVPLIDGGWQPSRSQEEANVAKGNNARKKETKKPKKDKAKK